MGRVTGRRVLRVTRPRIVDPNHEPPDNKMLASLPRHRPTPFEKGTVYRPRILFLPLYVLKDSGSEPCPWDCEDGRTTSFVQLPVRVPVTPVP